MVGFGLAGHFREIVVAKRELSCKRKIGGNVLFAVLLLHRVRPALQPRRVIMPWVAANRRVLRCRNLCAICAGKGAKIIVKAVVFLNDNHHVVDWIVRFHELLDTPMDSRPSIVSSMI